MTIQIEDEKKECEKKEGVVSKLEALNASKEPFECRSDNEKNANAA